jgi:hypothetical protein
LASTVLLYGSENWTVKSKDKYRLSAVEMKFMPQNAKYTWRDHESREEILNKLKVTSVLDKVIKLKDYNT